MLSFANGRSPIDQFLPAHKIQNAAAVSATAARQRTQLRRVRGDLLIAFLDRMIASHSRFGGFVKIRAPFDRDIIKIEIAAVELPAGIVRMSTNTDVTTRPTPSTADDSIPPRARIFLLSPANAGGIKGQRLLNSTSRCDLALRLRNSGASLGEIYGFISSLYFRGKLAYAERFQNPPRGVAGVHIITGAGLMLPETVVTLADLRRISSTSIDVKNADYRLPLDADLVRLREAAGRDTSIILLGSVATSKYITPLKDIFGNRLLFPRDFLGLGDMSRGSMLLRCCERSSELAYQRAEKIMQSE